MGVCVIFGAVAFERFGVGVVFVITVGLGLLDGVAVVVVVLGRFVVTDDA